MLRFFEGWWLHRYIKFGSILTKINNFLIGNRLRPKGYKYIYLVDTDLKKSYYVKYYTAEVKNESIILFMYHLFHLIELKCDHNENIR